MSTYYQTSYLENILLQFIFLLTTNFVKNMSYFSKNWKIRDIFFPRKFTPLKFDHWPVLKKAIKKERKKVHLNFQSINYDSTEWCKLIMRLLRTYQSLLDSAEITSRKCYYFKAIIFFLYYFKKETRCFFFRKNTPREKFDLFFRDFLATTNKNFFFPWGLGARPWFYEV